MAADTRFDWIVLSPGGTPDSRLAIAGSRAGAIGVLNLEFTTDADAALAELARLEALGRGRCGVLLDDESPLLPTILGEHAAGLVRLTGRRGQGSLPNLRSGAIHLRIY